MELDEVFENLKVRKDNPNEEYDQFNRKKIKMVGHDNPIETVENIKIKNFINPVSKKREKIVEEDIKKYKLPKIFEQHGEQREQQERKEQLERIRQTISKYEDYPEEDVEMEEDVVANIAFQRQIENENELAMIGEEMRRNAAKQQLQLVKPKKRELEHLEEEVSRKQLKLVDNPTKNPTKQLEYFKDLIDVKTPHREQQLELFKPTKRNLEHSEEVSRKQLKLADNPIKRNLKYMDDDEMEREMERREDELLMVGEEMRRNAAKQQQLELIKPTKRNLEHSEEVSRKQFKLADNPTKNSTKQLEYFEKLVNVKKPYSEQQQLEIIKPTKRGLEHLEEVSRKQFKIADNPTKNSTKQLEYFNDVTYYKKIPEKSVWDKVEDFFETKIPNAIDKLW